MRIITFRQILILHELMIKSHGGVSGLRESGMLKSAIGRPFASFEGEDLYPNIFLKAAALVQSIIKNHPFVDGNKRTAFVGAAIFLKMNNYLLVVPQKEVVLFMLKIASENLSVDEIAEWIKRYSEET